LPRFQNGRIVSGAKAYFYDAGTTTPRVTFQSAGGALHTQPVTVTGSGNFPAIHVSGSAAYKIRITDSSDVLLEEFDQLAGDAGAGGGGGGGGTTIPTGFVSAFYGTGVVSDWVRANGRTIGSSLSAGTERANDDTEDLFTHLWNSDANLSVSGGRGASAAADWAANKTIALPDMRFRSMVGMDDMGSTAAGRTTGGLFASGNGTTLGSAGGEAAHELTTAELAAHSHANTATTNSTGSHSHSGTTGGGGSHSHDYIDRSETAGSGAPPGSGVGFTNVTRTTDSVGSHTHAYVTSTEGAHSHTVTMTNATTGSGTAHNNMPPFILVSFYLKL
jgi:microcystin-dependent protein